MICPYYTRALYGARAMLVPIRMGTVRTMGNNMPTCRLEPTETSVTEKESVDSSLQELDHKHCTDIKVVLFVIQVRFR